MRPNPFKPWYGQSVMSDSIRNILRHPPDKMPWAHNNYIFSTERSGLDWHKKILNWFPYQADPPAPKEIVIAKRPIDILPLETFRVEFSLPVHDEVELYLDGFLFRKLPECTCQVNVLMRHGCRCGGV